MCDLVEERLAERLNIFPFFFFNDTATTEIYTLSLHDALPISYYRNVLTPEMQKRGQPVPPVDEVRSEEHTSELQSRLHLVCRLLLEKKKKLNDYVTVVTGVHSIYVCDVLLHYSLYTKLVIKFV